MKTNLLFASVCVFLCFHANELLSQQISLDMKQYLYTTESGVEISYQEITHSKYTSIKKSFDMPLIFEKPRQRVSYQDLINLKYSEVEPKFDLNVKFFHPINQMFLSEQYMVLVSSFDSGVERYFLFNSLNDVVSIITDLYDLQAGYMIPYSDPKKYFRIPKEKLKGLQKDFPNIKFDYTIESIFNLEYEILDLESTDDYIRNNFTPLLIYVGEVILRKYPGKWGVSIVESRNKYLILYLENGQIIYLEVKYINELEDTDFIHPAMTILYGVSTFFIKN